jgi:hypothetical protein
MKSLVCTLAALLAVGYSGMALAVQPVGYLDNAGCDVIAGWSQDQDIPDTPIPVHVYFNGPAGTPGAPAVAITANVHRDDLCAAIGSCVHGYSVMSPFSLHDGAPHDVYAYAIDNAGEGNPLLGNSPRTLQCTPSAQTGIRRKIDGVPSFEAWRFSSFWDLLPLAAAEADLLPEGMAIPSRPELVQADDGTPEVYLVDHGVRRHVTINDGSTWRLDLGQVVVLPAAEIQAMPLGTPLRPRPVLFIHGGLYLVDDPQPFVVMPSGSSSSSSSSGGDITPGEPVEGSTCVFSAGRSDRTNWFYAAALATLGLARSRRRATRMAKGNAQR